MNSARKSKNYSNKKNNSYSNEKVQLGTLIHIVEKQPVIKLTCTDIPYPNSPVLLNNQIIGKVDEVLGTLEQAYASITLDKDMDIKEDSIFFGYKDKFIFKKRFLPREDVEKKKEEKDKKYDRKGDRKYDRNMDGNKKRGTGYGQNDNRKGGDRRNASRSNDDKDRGNKRNYNDNRNDNKRYKK